MCLTILGSEVVEVVVCIKKIFVLNLLIYYTFNVLVDHRHPPQPWTL